MPGLRRLLHQDVEAGGGHWTGGQRPVERGLVDDGAPARVDQDRAGLHHAELARRHEIARGLVERDVQRDHVGRRQKLGEQHEADVERVFLGLGEPPDVVVLHAHVEPVRLARDLLADVAEAHEPERLALDLVAARVREVAHAPLAGHDVVVLPHQPLQHRQHQRDRVLGHRDGIRAAAVGDGHAGLARGLEVERVVAGRHELDQAQPGRGAEELVAHAGARKAEEELRIVQRLVEGRGAVIDGGHLEAGRNHGPGRVDDGRRQTGREDDLRRHGQDTRPVACPTAVFSPCWFSTHTSTTTRVAPFSFCRSLTTPCTVRRSPA